MLASYCLFISTKSMTYSALQTNGKKAAQYFRWMTFDSKIRFASSLSIALIFRLSSSSMSLNTHNVLIRALTATIEQQILSLPYLRDCPDNKGKLWLCRWCRSMNCPKRQQTLARLYSKNQTCSRTVFVPNGF